eukprot:750872-Hanusia_phi.AAC.2
MSCNLAFFLIRNCGQNIGVVAFKETRTGKCGGVGYWNITMLVTPKFAASANSSNEATSEQGNPDTDKGSEVRLYRRQSTAEMGFVKLEQDLLRKLDRLNVELEGTMDSMGATLSLAANIRSEVGNFIASWFSNLKPSELTEKIQQTFDKFDYKHTGVLDREEFHNAFASMGKRLAHEELEVLISDFDTNGDGTIDREEFEHMVRMEIKSPCRLKCKACKLLRKRSSSLMDAISQRAAILIQKLVRGVQVRKMLSYRSKAACMIQRVYRGRIFRKKVQTIRYAKAEIARAAKSKQTVITRNPEVSRAKMIASSVGFGRTASSGTYEGTSARRLNTAGNERIVLQSDRRTPQVNTIFLSLSVLDNEKQNRTRQVQSLALFRNNSDITDQLVHNSSFSTRRASGVSQSLQEPIHSWARRRMSANEAAHRDHPTGHEGFGRTQSAAEGFGKNHSAAEGFGRTQSAADGPNSHANEGHMTDRSWISKDPADISALQRRGNVVVRSLLMRSKTGLIIITMLVPFLTRNSSADTNNKGNEADSNFSSSSRRFKSMLSSGKSALPKRSSEGAHLPPVLNRVSQGLSSLKSRIVSKVSGKPKDANLGRKQSAPEPITFGRTSSAP